MIVRLTTAFVSVLFFAAGLASSGYAQLRSSLSLDGVWSFATDPGNRGETEGWHRPEVMLPKMPLAGYAPTADGTIRVPGIWDNQGYGVESPKVRHNFVGKGWYKRQVAIPRDWASRRIYLAITGVNRYAKVWVDDHFLGEQIGYLSIFERDVTQFASPGQTVTVTIQVDSKQRWEVDCLFGASSLADYMDVAWGGIWGHVLLEARPEAWLGDLFVQPEVANSRCSASAVLHGKTDLADSAKLDVFDAQGRQVGENTVKLDAATATAGPIAIHAPVPNAEPWTPDSPVLYRARLSLLQGGRVVDAVESRFGMREFTIDGYRILLNGKRIMLRGYGDDHIYPEQMAMPCDKQLHLDRLRIIKSYGFNHVRHHSTMLPPEYYDACDELGMITTSEFPICYSHFLPGTGNHWKAHVPPGTDPASAEATYRREWTAAIQRHRNHPSILAWVMGNELWDGIPLRHEFQRIARQCDPKRFFLDADGVWGARIMNPKNDRDTLDFYSIQFAEGTSPFDNPRKFQTPQPIKPSISHEAGNFVTFSRPDLADQFRHNMKPFWLSAGKEKLEKLGLMAEAGQWAEKSERLYALLHKANVEFLRKNVYLSGYHWWLFQDYWTSSNGLVDHYFRPKSITKEEVLQFNNDVVLLEDGLERTYRGKGRLEVALAVSNFSASPISGEFAWEVTAGDQSLGKDHVRLESVPQGDLAPATKISLDLPEATTPKRIRVAARLTVGARQIVNDWNSWVYPATSRPSASELPMLTDRPKAFGFEGWNLKSIPNEGPLNQRAVYVVHNLLDPRVIEAMDHGASVVLLGRVEPMLRSYGVTFRTSWWKAGDNGKTNHTGAFVYPHPVTAAMAPEGWCDEGWFHLLEGAGKSVLDKAPARPQVIVRALPSMALVEDDALLFEVGVGKGLLIASGFNHQRAHDRPENQWLLARLLDRAANPPRIQANWPASFLAVTYAAPEGSVPGFQTLLSKGSEEDTWHSYREDTATVFLCRQNKPGNRVAWETCPVPQGTSDRVTFAFAGALGFRMEPKTDGFILAVQGKELLRFDLPEPRRWTSADKQAELRFEVRRETPGDQFGLFHLTVPRAMLQAGRPCRLEVRSLGTGSRRWFGLHPYSDVR